MARKPKVHVPGGVYHVIKPSLTRFLTRFRFSMRRAWLLMLVLAIGGVGCATKGDVTKMGEAVRGEMTAIETRLEDRQKELTARLNQVQDSIKNLAQTANIATSTHRALITNLKAEEMLLRERLKTIEESLKTLE